VPPQPTTGVEAQARRTAGIGRTTRLLLVVGVALTLLATTPLALGAEPTPVLIDPLDPRAEGEGAGLVGDPLVAAIAVILLGALAVAATAAYVRWADRR